MIGIRDFGWRLGNQMFQIAAAIGVAEKYGDKVAFPQWDYAKYFNGDFTPVDFNPNSVYVQNEFHYNPIPYKEDMAIQGYFQSEKFFGHCKKKIRSIFSIKDEIVNKVRLDRDRIMFGNSGRLTAIHVRRGDYLKYPDHHPQQTENYYRSSIGKFPTIDNQYGQKFIVFSDDPEWCGQQDMFLNMEICVLTDDIETLALMTLCDDFIIGNSSYSWWGAWLGQSVNKTVIAPKTWFGPAYAHWNTKDVYCEDWIKL